MKLKKDKSKMKMTSIAKYTNLINIQAICRNSQGYT